MKPTLSVVLATRNEAENIERCLDSIKNIADEIVIADEESTDNTLELAKKYGARIIKAHHNINFHVTKNLAINAAKMDWTLQLDADEVISPELGAEITSEISRPTADGYWINRKNWFLTKFLSKGGQYPDPTLRLYKSGKGRLPAKDVHEQAQVDGKVSSLKSDLLHYRDTSFEKYIDGFNRYTSFISIQLKEKHQPLGLMPTLNYLFVKPLITFLKIFVRHRGYIDGKPGFIFALYSGLVHGVAYIKYWQANLTKK